ncbi:MAG TPA: sigma factor [Sandaracinaceae bacterium LLY-WYZ-13_1]|nr:sigma factor [Sandaracinaceae bacterium LLY-WYZ-13_1]
MTTDREDPRAAEATTPLGERLARHRTLVAATVARYARPDTPRAELSSEGLLGLLDAASRFDPRAGTPFDVHARWWVRHYVRRRVRKARPSARERRLRALGRRLDARLGPDGLAELLEREVVAIHAEGSPEDARATGHPERRDPDELEGPGGHGAHRAPRPGSAGAARDGARGR